MKVLTETGLGHLVERIRELIPGLATEEEPGLLRELSGREDQVLLGTGEWGEYRGGGGGSAGPMWLEVDAAGDLYAYYDDGSSAPALEYEEATGNLYALFETEA